MSARHQHFWTYHLHHPKWSSHTGRLRLEQKPGETMQHLMMKACSYFIFYHPQLMIEQKTQQRR